MNDEITIDGVNMKVYKAINNIQSALAKVGISKDQKNVQQGYKFRGIDDIYGALAPLLSEHGLCILPTVLDRLVTTKETKSGTAMFYVVVHMKFDLVCTEDSTMHTISTYGEAMDSGDKATNKAMSAAFKYACLQAFCIPTEGDNDADLHTHEVKAPAKTEIITPEELAYLNNLADLAGADKINICKRLKIVSLNMLPRNSYVKLCDALQKQAEGANK